MITNFFIPELNNHDVQELWFQQDGATCHTARAIIDLLKDTFGDRLISRFGPVNWPPRSCDLTPLDYFLWGYVNDRKELELRAERDKENQRIFELQKLQITTDTSITADSNMPKLELHKLLPIFDSKSTDVAIFLDIFERQLTFLKVPVPQWVVYRVGLSPTEFSNLIAKESVIDAQDQGWADFSRARTTSNFLRYCGPPSGAGVVRLSPPNAFAVYQPIAINLMPTPAQDYYKVKQILLKRFKLSAEKFRQMFSRHTKEIL
ncbi:uncharacterized protein TNCV_4389921 [Trichonephila clavipes]|nr:uncharacterized protein TNCV_4389921 [Trichonephila clavipes]